MNINSSIRLASEYYQTGDLEKAEYFCKMILKKQPDNADALHFMGMIHYQLGNYDLAEKYIRKELIINPNDADVYNNLGLALHCRKQIIDAVSYYQKALDLNPSLFYIYFNLGNAFKDMKQFEEALNCYSKTLQLNPNLTEAYNNMGVVLKDTGQLDEAITYFQKALEINPNIPDIYYNLGLALRDRGRLDESIACYQKALQLNPGYADAYSNLGNAFNDKGRLDEAIICYQKALKLNPDFADAYSNLGHAFHEKSHFEEAVAYYQKALKIRPDFAYAHNNMGNLFKDMGNLKEAESCYRRAIEINPDNSIYYSNFLFLMNYNATYNCQIILSEHLRFAKQFAKPLSSAILPHTNTPSTSRRLKIGYVSPDLRRHSVAYFIEPVFAAHNHSSFEVYCYSDVICPDTVTERLQQYADQWRNIVGMSDEKVAELAKKDGIDILIDLAGHTANNRMLLFARKPAPVQVSWIGYPNTTGLSTIDYRIVDSYTDPEGLTDPFYIEKILRLPESFLCYMPDKESPEVSGLPALVSGKITFGSFNHFPKVSSETVMLWAGILKAITDARLIMKAKSLSDKGACHNAIEMFKAQGIAEERIELLSHIPSFREHLDTYNRIDVCLDTFPYNGTTTTCEALWMGVPVITLSGNTHTSRVGASLLSNIGLSELVAGSPEEYVSIAVNLANNINKLQSLRKRLRDMMSHSPLTDAKQFAVNLEQCYRTIWKNWCKETINKGLPYLKCN